MTPEELHKAAIIFFTMKQEGEHSMAKTKKEQKKNQKPKKNNKEKEALVDKTGADPIGTAAVEEELDALPNDDDPADDDLPVALELLLMAFENFKKHGLQYPPGVQFDVDGFTMEIEDSLKSLVDAVRGYVEVEEDDDDLLKDDAPSVEGHAADCACEGCIKMLVEYEASKIPGVKATSQCGRA